MNRARREIDHGAEHELPLLQAATVLALLAGIVGTLTGGAVSRAAGGVAVGVIVGIPFVRIADLSRRWAKLGDRRFAAVGLLLLVVVAVGAAITIQRR